MTKLDLIEIGQDARAASRQLARAKPAQIDLALAMVATALVERLPEIVDANSSDVERARANGVDDHVVDRLVLDQDRLASVIEGVRAVAALPSPIGQETDSRVLSNGMRLSRRRVPLGVIGVIYESRPNVTADISSLCLKSGNAVILRGGKESIQTNTALARVFRDCLLEASLPHNSIQLIPSTDRAVVETMLRMRDHIDLLIPRGVRNS